MDDVLCRHVTVAYDDRDADRKDYAPPLTDAGVADGDLPNHIKLERDVTWAQQQQQQQSSRAFDSVAAMAGMSRVQASEFVQLAERTPAYAMNGIPGFNIGAANPDAPAHLERLKAGGGLVEDASAACLFSVSEQQLYLQTLPPLARGVAMRSRVTFPFTARGRTDDGCGAYGRQFRDTHDKPTRRSTEWYASLALDYAEALAAETGGGGSEEAAAQDNEEERSRIASAMAALRQVATELRAQVAPSSASSSSSSSASFRGGPPHSLRCPGRLRIAPFAAIVSIPFLVGEEVLHAGWWKR